MSVSTTVSIDEQLNRLEDEIRRLKVEFDIFFNGGAVKPPYDTKYRVESLVKRLYDVRGMSFGQRFRYNSLVSRFNVYKELWRRNIKEREEGSTREREAIVEPVKKHLPAVVRCCDPAAEPDKVRELYDHLVRAKRSCGEPVDDVSFDRFERMIGAQVRQIKEKLNCEEIEFTIEIADGAVKFKAKAAKAGEPGA
jgi:hypothetical protein